jgi:Spy/CpxP family protein refolding chaperone
MSMRVRVLTFLGILAAAGMAVSAVAEERPRREARPGLAGLEAELGLSAEQAAQMRNLRAEGRKQAIRHRADVAIARLELEELMDARTVDEKAVAAKVKAISDLEAAALKARTDERLAMRRLLTPEQQEKLKQLGPRGRRGRAARPGRAWRPER